MNELQKFKKVMADGCSFQAILAGVKIRPNNWQQPIREERLKEFAIESGFS